MSDSFRPIREALEYDRRYEEAAQFRDWQTCEFLQDTRPEEIEQALAALAGLEAEHERLKVRLIWEEHRHEADVLLLTQGPGGHDFCSCVLSGKPCEVARSVLSGEGA